MTLMTSKELRQKYLDFFKEKGHSIISPASLIPENDPTVLFTTAGMHPLVPFLLGEKHPGGKRLADCQPCIRTDDIYEVGDCTHLTFFEMLGNWSLGDYFKKEAIQYSFEFLTDKKWLGIPLEKLAFSFFAGDEDAPRDEEAKNIWLGLGVSEKRIKGLPKKDNWWGPAGQVGPCGPDTEMFYWSGKEKAPENFDPNDKKWVEIWNDVFMQYFKNMDGVYESLPQKNVDTGMGLERTLAVLNGEGNVYMTDLFEKPHKKLHEFLKKEDCTIERVVLDHLRAATFLAAEGVEPSNKDRGYIARRLIRRAIIKAKQIGIEKNLAVPIAEEVIETYKDFYPILVAKKENIKNILRTEEEKFEITLEQGLKEFEKGKDAFTLYTTYGFPIELTLEIAKEKGITVDIAKFEEELKKHQELSRTASAGMFKGGLADTGEKAAKYHTATHLLLAALREILGDHVFQRGSNITAERMRFDFSHPQKMTPEEIKKVEDIVNEKIKENIPVVCAEMGLDEAKGKGMMGIFENKYGEKVKTYAISEFSKEICGGPHANSTGDLGKFKIIKEEASSSGVRRIKAVLE
jgi:alanyl-tRNA synthetase